MPFVISFCFSSFSMHPIAHRCLRADTPNVTCSFLRRAMGNPHYLLWLIRSGKRKSLCRSPMCWGISRNQFFGAVKYFPVTFLKPFVYCNTQINTIHTTIKGGKLFTPNIWRNRFIWVLSKQNIIMLIHFVIKLICWFYSQLHFIMKIEKH